MDTSLTEAIKRTEEHLKRLKNKDPEAVYHCPKCGNDYSNLMNYRELGMCGACYRKTKTEEMQKLADALVGGTIVEVKVAPVEPLLMDTDKPMISKIIVLKNGKKIELKQPPQIEYCF